MTKFNKLKYLAIIMPIVLWVILFFALYASYTMAAFPQGDDAIHLFMWTKHALPEPGGHIAARVVDAFFNRYLFLIFRPIDYMTSGGTFFQSFTRYTGLLNSIIACWLTAITFSLAHSGLRCNYASRLAILGCSLALTLQVMFGDTTHAIAYNLTLAIVLTFISAVMPLQDIFGNPSQQVRPVLEVNTYCILLAMSYFSAFGIEIYNMFVWVYLCAGYVCRNQFLTSLRTLPRFAHKPLQDIWRIFGLVTASRYRQLILWYAFFSLLAFVFLLGSGRAGAVRIYSPFNVGEIVEYLIGFLRGFRRNPAFLFWSLSLILIATNCILLFLINKNIRRPASVISVNMRWPYFFQPLFFCLLVNAAYLTILFITGYKDSRTFVATLESPNFYTGRSLLFLSPILYVNLAIVMRGMLIIGKFITAMIAPFLLVSLLLLLSSSFHFLDQVRARSVISAKVEKAFEIASTSDSDEIVLPFCIPGLFNNEGGYPILPTANAYQWYRASYRYVFELYYNKSFSEKGPIFRLSNDLSDSCVKR